MLSKHSVRRFVRHSRLLTCNISRCKCWTSTIIQLSDIEEQTKDISHVWKPSPENQEAGRDRTLMLEIPDTSPSSFGSAVFEKLNGEKTVYDDGLHLKETHSSPLKRENFCKRSSYDQQENSILKNATTALLASNVTETGVFNKIFHARYMYFHNLTNKQFSHNDPNSKSVVKEKEINHELDRKPEEEVLSEDVENSEHVNECLCSDHNSLSERELKQENEVESAVNIGQNIQSKHVSSYILSDKYDAYLSASSVDMEGIDYVDIMKSTQKNKEINYPEQDPKLLAESKVASNAVIESSRKEKALTSEITERRYMSILEETIREKENLDMTIPFDDETNPIFPSLPLVKTQGDLAPYENELTKFDPKKRTKVTFPKIYHLAPLVNQSEVLTKLVKLGVDLSEIEKKRLANQVVKMDFKKDVKPYLLFLHDIGVPSDEMGKILTKAPSLLQEDIETLKVRIKYFKSKKFKKEDIASMVTDNCKFLFLTTEKIDERLGFYQKQFKLKGWEVRKVFVDCSKLLLYKEEGIKITWLQLKEFYGFTELELKKMLLRYPKLYAKDVHLKRKQIFDILTNKMEIPHSLIVMWPKVFDADVITLEQRHRFLLKVDRAQYDPKKENYVALQIMTETNDQDFCVNVAKATVTEYYQFLKTI